MMAYNSFFPASYQPMYYPQQQYVPTPQNSIIWVSGEREALAYPVAPNNAVTLWSQSEPVVYLKQADASGRPSVKVYDLVERTEPTQASKAEDREVCEYATKDALKELNKAVEAVKKDVAKIRAEMEDKE